MMFLDCPACLDEEGTPRCGLPAEVRCRFTMRSTDGPLEAAMIRCPAGHWFTGPVESSPGNAKTGTLPAGQVLLPTPGVTAASALMMAVTAAAGSPSGISPPGRGRKCPARAPLLPTIWGGPPACGSPPCARAAAAPHPNHLTEAVTAADNERHPGAAASQPAADAAGRVPLTLA